MKANGNHDFESFKSFKHWVSSLNREELLDAMSFTFYPDANSPMQSTSIPTMGSTSKPVNSHEYELLASMVRLQPPCPTPVHPRAVGYKSRSRKGARLDYFFKEEEHLRWIKPRLFQWAEEESKSSIFNNNNGERMNNRDRLRNRNQSRAKNLVGKSASKRRFSVIARRKVAPWGEVYSLGCTQEQRDADSNLLRGMRLGRQRRDGFYHTTGCFVCSGTSETSHTSSAASILRMLWIASRGYLFLQQPIPPESKTTTTEIPYCAPWLQPTERWFSLSMYIASRFQMALWDSYLKDYSNTLRRQCLRQSSLHPGRVIRQGGIWDCYKESTLRDSLIRSIGSALREILQNEQTSSCLDYLRDGTLWSILECSPNEHHYSPEISTRQLSHHNKTSKGYWTDIVCSWLQTKLVELDNPFNSEFKILVNEKFERELATQMEHAILEEDKLDRQKNHNFASKDDLSAKKKRKKNKKKQKKRKSNNNSVKSKVSQLNDTAPSSLMTSAKIEDDPLSILSETSSVEEEALTVRVVGSTHKLSKISVSALDRNRNVILVLGILEDITEQVFLKVGLMPTPKFDVPVEDACLDSDSPKSTLEPNSSNPISQNGDIMNKEIGIVEASIDGPLTNPCPESYTSSMVHSPHSVDQDLKNLNDENAFSIYTEYDKRFQSNVHNPFAVGSDFALNNLDDIGGYVDNWRFVNRYQSRERSILTNFFESQNEKRVNDNNDDDEERLMAASTAASIASSTYKDTTSVAETDDLTIPDQVVNEQSVVCAEMSAIRETDDAFSKCSKDTEETNRISGIVGNAEKSSSIKSIHLSDLDARSIEYEDADVEVRKSVIVDSGSDLGNDSNDTMSGCRSPTLEAPRTPPPTLSPILVSLADLKKVKQFSSLDLDDSTLLSGPGSLPPNSPEPQGGIVCSWSREDLRIHSFRDDHRIQNQKRDRIKFRDDHRIQNQKRDRIKSRRGLEIPTYKSIAIKALAKPIASYEEDTGSLDPELQSIESPRRKQHQNKESCAQSETAMDTNQGEHQDWYREEAGNNSFTKDETTTIISGISHRVESEELAVVQEERNNFRDMCLTLGAEVAKLKVMLATQQAAAAAAPVDFQEPSYGYSKMYGHGSFDPHGMQPFFNGLNNGLRPGPMSDAGFHRYGDHESLFSEDELHDPISKTRDVRMDSMKHMASSQTLASQTVAGSDVSIDFNSIKFPLLGVQIPGTMPAYDSFQFNGLQSRLAKDILQFLDATNAKMKNLDGKRKLAVQRFSRLVKTVWPRAQVKLYGSYISGLCLPSSDLDFVVCLPAVHKKDLALAPGVLEGRNAINETSQKLLARELKGESWIDPRSIKVIERTAVPVIKVSTKDTRAKMIQLDISFDGPEHHGLDANRMVAQTMEELPLIRPLMLVLKQFLLHRGLLTAYTGGLSSYCLFLMLARYLQEQPLSSGDCGSLLMGFLDFYGNFFDPRAIGISVGGRRYFARANSNTAAAGYEPTGQPIWNRSLPPHQQHQKHVIINNIPTNSSSNSVVSRRRNSFSDTGSVDDSRHRYRYFTKPNATSTVVTTGPNHRFVPLNNNAHATHPKEFDLRSNGNINFSGYDRPSTFDPLFVEDPLSATNNVGRNAFRINQVQRAFSDAHKSIVASLDWDIQNAEGNGKYPLLKCLLGNQREDVLYGI